MKNYRWETVDDVDFFTNGVVCTDINIKDTVKQLCFQHMVIDIDRDNKKVFPNIEEIYISPKVVNICIPNKMFPNVKNVKSDSKVFNGGKYLVVKSTLRLLNAFGQSEDTPLDGSNFLSINEYALDGCKSHEFVNLFPGGKFTTYENSFTGSGFMEQPFVNGLKAFKTHYGTTILDIDENADIVILPEGKIKFHQLKPAKCVKVSDAKSLYYAARLAPEKLILEPGSSTAEPFDGDDFLMALYCIPCDYCESWEVAEEEFKNFPTDEWEITRTGELNGEKSFFIIPAVNTELRKLLHEHAAGYKEEIEKEISKKIQKNIFIDNCNTGNLQHRYYRGVLGVPITFLNCFSPEQFRIVGNEYSLALNKGRGYVHGKRMYSRIFIQKIL